MTAPTTSFYLSNWGELAFFCFAICVYICLCFLSSIRSENRILNTRLSCNTEQLGYFLYLSTLFWVSILTLPNQNIGYFLYLTIFFIIEMLLKVIMSFKYLQ
ncbi:unnamed protein product [Prunus armeniaca]